MNNITEYSLSKANKNEEAEGNYFLEKSKDNKNIIRVKKDDKLVYLGSKYSVTRDIEKLLGDVKDININTIIVVFGLGTGEHILELMKKISKTNKIIIIEPDENIINIFKDMPYAEEITKRENNAIYLLNKENTEFVLGSFIEEFNVNNIKIIAFANYGDVYEEEFKYSLKMVNEYVSHHLINIGTYLVLAKDCFTGYMKNLKFIVESSILNDFRDSFKDKPAVVVSAGPSLEKNIHLLKDAKDKFFIVSGGRTLRPLLEIGVVPDIVCIVDPSDEYYDLMKSVLDKNIPLLFCEGTSYKVMQDYTGPKIFFREAIALGNVTNEMMGMNIDSLWQGGSVAHVCAAFASYIGCSPIVFIGQDFAYTGEKFHADIAKVQSVDENLKLSENDFYVDDVFGDQVRTNRVLNGYRRYMESFIKLKKETKFINSTEGGANMEGTEVMTFKEAIDTYCKESFDKEILKQSINNKDVDKEKVVVSLKETKDRFKDIKKSCEKGLDYVEKVEKQNNQNKSINNLLNKMSEINKSMNNMEIINHLLKTTMYKILMNPKFAEKENESYEEVIKRLIDQSKMLYKGVTNAIDEAEPLIDEAIEDLTGELRIEN